MVESGNLHINYALNISCSSMEKSKNKVYSYINKELYSEFV